MCYVVDAAPRDFAFIARLRLFLCRYGKTALLWAVEIYGQNGHDSTVLLLLEHHADVNAADK